MKLICLIAILLDLIQVTQSFASWFSRIPRLAISSASPIHHSGYFDLETLDDDWFPLTSDNGIMKKVIIEGTDYTSPRPRKRAVCNVDMNCTIIYPDKRTNYIGYKEKLVLQMSGKNEFSWNNPYHKYHGLRGYFVGFPSMRVGETADFLFSPYYGYGEIGGVPEFEITEDATLYFTVKLNACIMYSPEREVDSESQQAAWEAQLNADPLMKQSTIHRMEAEREAEIIRENNPYPPVHPEPNEEYRAMSEEQLRYELSSKGLPNHGHRDLLVKRLETFAPKEEQESSAPTTKRPSLNPFDDIKQESRNNHHQSPYVDNAQYSTNTEKTGENSVKQGHQRPRHRSKVRMLQDEPHLKEDPNTRIKGREENSISYSENLDDFEESEHSAVVMWDEKMSSIDVFVVVNPMTELGRDMCTTDISVTLKPRRLRVQLTRSDDVVLTLASGELVNPIDSEESFWWLEDLDQDEWGSDMLNKMRSPGSEKRVKLDPNLCQVVRLSLKKRARGIWSGVWKHELKMAQGEIGSGGTEGS